MQVGIRVQLQQQRGGRTIHHASEVIVAHTDEGVSVAQVRAALLRLRSAGAIPPHEAARADAALARALRWLEVRPPAGVSGQFSRSFYFAPEDPSASWRFDIEGLRGTHLRS